jgi:hypothetical protein
MHICDKKPKGSLKKNRSPMLLRAVYLIIYEKLIPMCIDSSNELIEDLHHRMKKITRKAARKL